MGMSTSSTLGADLLGHVLPDVLVVEDLAHHLCRSPSAIRRLLRTGELPGRRIGHRWVTDRGALLRALADERQRPALRVLGRSQ